jgi:hypothetical protein
MQRVEARVLIGALLVALGLLFFLEALGRIAFPAFGMLWAIIFLGAGAIFLYVFLRDRSHWWALFPGMPLLGIGATILLDTVAPSANAVLGGAIVLGSVSLSFWLVYWVRRDFWWAIIPGGCVATLALIALLSSVLGGAESGALLFLGLGLTFLALSFLPEERGRQPWAVIPAAILVFMAAFTGLAFGTAARFFWPILFIVGGVILLVRARRGPTSGGGSGASVS